MKRYALISLLVMGIAGLSGCDNWLTPTNPNTNTNTNQNSNENENTNDNTTTNAPTISNFMPSSGQAELKPVVTICGTHLDTVTGAMIGNQEATILGQNSEDMLIELPETSTSGFLSVVNPSGTAVSETEFLIIDLDPTETASLALGALAQAVGMAADSTIEVDSISKMIRQATDTSSNGEEEETLEPNPFGAAQLLTSLYSLEAVRHGSIDAEESAMNEVIENLVTIALNRYESGKIWTSGEIDVYYNPDCIRGVVLESSDFEYLSMLFPFEVRSCVEGGGVSVEVSGTLHLAENKVQIWFEGSVTKSSSQIMIDGTGSITVGLEDHYFTCNEIVILSDDKMPSSGSLTIGDPPIAVIVFTEETPETGMVYITTEGETFEQSLPDPVTGYASDPDVYNYTGLWTTSSARANPARYQKIWAIEEEGEFAIHTGAEQLTWITNSVEGTSNDLEDKIAELQETAEDFMNDGFDRNNQDETFLEKIEDFYEKITTANDTFDAETISGMYLYSDRNYPDRYTLGMILGKAVGPRAYAFYTETTYLQPNPVDSVIEYGQTGILEMNMENDKAFTVEAYPLFPYSNYQGLVLPWNEYCLRTGINVAFEVDLEEGSVSFEGYFSSN